MDWSGVGSLQAESRSRMKALLTRPPRRSAGPWSRRRLVIAAVVVTCASAAGPESAQAVPPVNTERPEITGNAVEGETLIGDTGRWIGAGSLTFSYQWQRSAGLGYADIAGADENTYVLTAADVDHKIRLRVTATNAADEATSVESDPTDPVAAAPKPSLNLLVAKHPQAYKRATVRAVGATDFPLDLWVYENLRRNACPAVPADRTRGMRGLVTGVEVDGDFSEKRRPMMKNPGRHAYCAYLGLDEDTAEETSFTDRRVRKPLLTEARAERTVASALSRHGFAGRVLGNLQESCRRRSRNEFQCRFSSTFPGYSLTGHGSVKLTRGLSYRFQVSARGRSFRLTPKNEGGFPS
jgi:hypothetical protein